MPMPIYLDYNATTPHDPAVVAAMRPFLETEFGNPSSSHVYGLVPKKAVETSRRQVAALLGCLPEEIVFTSGGTESNNFAIKGIARACRRKGGHIITTRIEHPAVLEVCRHLAAEGVETTYLPVDRQGLVSVSDVKRAIRPETFLITVMHANNEVGAVQPLREISMLAKSRGIAVHTDAAQSIGKIKVKVDDLGVDLLSLAGHKVYAPKGIGALFIRRTAKPEAFVHGAGQEMGKRAGTENVLEIVGLGEACRVAEAGLAEHEAHMRSMRDLLYAGLKKNLTQIRLNGHSQQCLPNTLSISFKGVTADRLLEIIGPEVAVSAGAACHANTVNISYVLLAMDVPEQWAKGTLRISTGRMTTAVDVDRAVAVISDAVKKLSDQGADI